MKKWKREDNKIIAFFNFSLLENKIWESVQANKFWDNSKKTIVSPCNLTEHSNVYNLIGDSR